MIESFTIEDEQYALLNYLQNANPGPVLKQIAEDRIKWLEAKKSNGKPRLLKPDKPLEHNFYLRNNITIE